MSRAANSETQVNFVDRVVSFFNPRAGYDRARYRQLEGLMRKFEGATGGRRGKNWLAPSSDADAALFGSIERLRNRSRDLVRNNPYAARGMAVIVSNTIGTGIVARIHGEQKRATARLQELWKRWAESTECDADGIHDIYGLQALALRTVVESGEVLIRRRRRKIKDGLAVPLQLQVLEPDFIDNFKSESLSSGGTISNGIEYGSDGKVVAYWLYPEHPGSQVINRGPTLQSFRVPASEILHVFKRDRPGQGRGVPWLAPVMLRLRDFDEYEDAQLLKQKVAACFAAFVTAEAPVDDTPSKAPISDKIEPGGIEILPSGKNITFASPPSVQGYSEYSSSVIGAVAVGLGVTYEAITGDLSNVNFSSGRMGWLEFHRNIESWRWLLFIPRFCQPVFGWFKEAASLQEGVDLEAGQCDWTPPRREMIDPAVETKAAIAQIRAGLSSLPAQLRQLGEDPKQVLEEIAESNDLLDKLKLTLDSDPRKVTASGQDPGQGSQGSDDGASAPAKKKAGKEKPE